MSSRVVVACALVAVAWACGTGVDLGGTAFDAAAQADVLVCPGLAAPATSAQCNACDGDPSDKTCPSTLQANGCFGGYLCDVSERDCKKPDTSCSTTGKFDAD